MAEIAFDLLPILSCAVCFAWKDSHVDNDNDVPIECVWDRDIELCF